MVGPSGSGKTTLLDRVCGLLGEEHSQWQIRSALGEHHLSGSAGARQLWEPLPLALDHYSGGEIHRLGLLRAWLRDRPVELLDEPTAFLDGESARRVRRILLERSRQRLVLVSTHDADLIGQADRVLRLQPADRRAAERQHQGSWGSAGM